MGDFSDFLKNENQNQDAAVSAPAFSITKVVTIFTPLLAGLATALVAAVDQITFTASQVTALVVALFAFLAVTCAADVLARSRVESARRSAEAAVQVAHQEATSAIAVAGKGIDAARAAARGVPARPDAFVRFRSPLAGSVGQNGHRRAGFKIEGVQIVAASNGEFLCLRDGGTRLSWEPADRITFKN